MYLSPEEARSLGRASRSLAFKIFKRDSSTAKTMCYN